MLYIYCFTDNRRSKTKKKEKSDNPFSFKKFLASSGTKQLSEGSSSSKVKPNDVLEAENDSTGTFPKFSSELPDFVQDHYSDSVTVISRSPENEFHLSETPPLDLPDFTEHSRETKVDVTEEEPSGTEGYSSSLNDRLGLNSNDKDEVDVRLYDENDSSCLSVDNLPDFLSDGAIGNARSLHRSLILDSDKSNAITDKHTNDDLTALKVSPG